MIHLKRLIALSTFLLLALSSGGPLTAQWERISGQGSNNILCFGSSNKYLFAGTDSGILRSGDNGLTWSDKNDGLRPDSVREIATINSNIYVLANRSDLFRSSNDGDSWKKIALGIDTVLGYGLQITSLASLGDDLFVGTLYYGLYRSTDEGVSWHNLSNGITPSNIHTILRAGSTLFATGDNDFYRSDDSGATWVIAIDMQSAQQTPIVPTSELGEINSNLFGLTLSTGAVRSIDKGQHWQRIASLPGGATHLSIWDSSLFATTVSGIYRSDDLGASWKLLNATIKNPQSFAVNGSAMFTSDGSGIYRSIDSALHWNSVNVYVNYSFGPLIRAGVNLYDGGFLSTDFGMHWINTENDFYSFIYSGGNLFGASHATSDILISTDEGTTWMVSSHLGASCFATVGSQLFAGANGVWRYSDTGKTWISANGSTFSGLPSGHITALASIGTSLFAGMESYGLYLSTDMGASWNRVNSAYSDQVYSLAVSANTIYEGMLGDLWYSDDDGAHWTARGNLQYHYVYSIAPYGSNLFIGTQFGVLFSKDFGSDWVSINDNLPNGAASSILIADGYLYAATDAGVWRRHLSDFGISSLSQASLTTQSLRCYPNPLSQSATISFTPEASGYAEISIVNQLGVEVARIFSGELDAGEHSFTWDARGVGPLRPTGMYECVVRMNGRTETLPIVLLR